jgi:hypothetical protein
MWTEGPAGLEAWRRSVGRVQTVGGNFSRWGEPRLVLASDEWDTPDGGIKLPVAPGGDSHGRVCH